MHAAEQCELTTPGRPSTLQQEAALCFTDSAHVVPVSCNNRVFPRVLTAASVNAILGRGGQLIVRNFCEMLSYVFSKRFRKQRVSNSKPKIHNTDVGLKGSQVSCERAK